ncbi:MAG: methyltransferase [Alphaproteobacteria bacterium]|nr:methyltransferase [Alphaproteobacteria bacterium]MBV9694352.1 methyltransferase [Alphaproteobacteria bacterium]
MGGRVVAEQPRSGFRAGLDAVMLAAAVPAEAGDEVLELGAGAGTASLCLEWRVPCRIVGVELEQALVDLAMRNASANGFADRVHFVRADVFALPAELKRDFVHVFCNPPFHDPAGESSPDPARSLALRDVGRLGDWLEAGVKRTASGGTFTLILRADRMAEALAHLPDRGISVFPLWPRAGAAAKRVVVQLRKGASHPLALLAGLVLHDATGAYTPAADAILREGAQLRL